MTILACPHCGSITEVHAINCPQAGFATSCPKCGAFGHDVHHAFCPMLKERPPLIPVTENGLHLVLHRIFKENAELEQECDRLRSELEETTERLAKERNQNGDLVLEFGRAVHEKEELEQECDRLRSKLEETTKRLTKERDQTATELAKEFADEHAQTEALKKKCERLKAQLDLKAQIAGTDFKVRIDSPFFTSVRSILNLSQDKSPSDTLDALRERVAKGDLLRSELEETTERLTKERDQTATELPMFLAELAEALGIGSPYSSEGLLEKAKEFADEHDRAERILGKMRDYLQGEEEGDLFVSLKWLYEDATRHSEFFDSVRDILRLSQDTSPSDTLDVLRERVAQHELRRSKLNETSKKLADEHDRAERLLRRLRYQLDGETEEQLFDSLKKLAASAAANAESLARLKLVQPSEPALLRGVQEALGLGQGRAPNTRSRSCASASSRTIGRACS
jgi:flagellin-specific chaperone FliS